MSALKDSKLVAISVGTHTWRPDDEKVDKIVAILKKHNVKNLDTAFAYVRFANCRKRIDC